MSKKVVFHGITYDNVGYKDADFMEFLTPVHAPCTDKKCVCLDDHPVKNCHYSTFGCAPDEREDEDDPPCDGIGINQVSFRSWE